MVKTTELDVGNIKKLIIGSLISIVTTIILLFVFSIVLTYSSLSEATIPLITIIITAISILVGSQITTSHIKKNGALNGSIVRYYIYTFNLFNI